MLLDERDRLLGGTGQLTDRQREILRLMARGLSNREIAARRFVSVKAVEYQLANAYRKLGISTRSELPAALGAEAAPDR